MSGDGESDGIIVEGKESDSGGVATNTSIRVVSPGYFQTMEIPLLRGRDFLKSDQADSLQVAIVDEPLARSYWPDGNALGKRIRMGWSDQWMTIVGVVGGIKDSNLNEELEPHLYSPYAQKGLQNIDLTVRTVGEPASITAVIRSVVRELDADLPLWKVSSMSRVVDNTLNNQRLTNLLLALFALLAVVLATVGIYGVMAVNVSHRTTEFGIRLALGAKPGAVLRLVVGQGMKIACCGVLVGLIAAFWLMRLLESMLFEVKANDPLIFTVVALGLLLASMIACYLPARQATKVDPLIAIRCE
jgi:putative ABC transport system permease protein